ncbi:bifunctional metallophosphatase/5'-nucleotidase [Roseateles saccharophilus]|uniref:5'-nucleotidase n=1 Tax=Roseateles saccharophilus TaxID=304 RepID=A0A4R3V216_ROSSA|nr:bifunctional metallophosphatase/5'-nucleotidase [Roseateles saccharophilus]MDG0833746.1 bifunctional metallophosphatase/5'-nucleotidase [Roseateles saccharophilus]TCU98826.1 5'-nucleotidase [Roseateles saccharophilus]
MAFSTQFRFSVGIAFAALLAGCAAQPAAAPTELTLFSINDFHGNIQPAQPTPLMPRVANPATGEVKAQPAGGVAYLASALAELRARHPDSLVVAGGDLIGASPLISGLLRDEPTLAAMSRLDISASALGNHELDAGLPELLRKAHGECGPTECLWPGFKGPGFPYLGANVLDAATGQPLLPTHVVKQAAGFKVAIAGVATLDTPHVIVARAIQGIRFADEADTLNALVPRLKAEGAQVLVAVMHEGGVQGPGGAANDASYACPTLSGRVLDIARRLDPAYAIIIGGHTHQAYTCKINGRLVVQAGSYGGWITESRLKLDAAGHVLDAQAINHPVLQSVYAPNPALAALVAQAAALTAAQRNKPVATLPRGATRHAKEPNGDSWLGNLIADSQLAFARRQGPADIAFMNPGGIRADLSVEPDKPTTMSDLIAIQPFGNDVVALTLTGQQIRDILQRQLPRGGAEPRMLQPSSTLRYHWRVGTDGNAALGEVLVGGQPLERTRDYRVVVNNFLSEGGDAQAGFKHGRDRAVLGTDIDALVDLLRANPDAVRQAAPGRIVRD